MKILINLLKTLTNLTKNNKMKKEKIIVREYFNYPKLKLVIKNKKHSILKKNGKYITLFDRVINKVYDDAINKLSEYDFSTLHDNVYYLLYDYINSNIILYRIGDDSHLNDLNQIDIFDKINYMEFSVQDFDVNEISYEQYEIFTLDFNNRILNVKSNKINITKRSNNDLISILISDIIMYFHNTTNLYDLKFKYSTNKHRLMLNIIYEMYLKYEKVRQNIIIEKPKHLSSDIFDLNLNLLNGYQIKNSELFKLFINVFLTDKKFSSDFVITNNEELLKLKTDIKAIVDKYIMK